MNEENKAYYDLPDPKRKEVKTIDAKWFLFVLLIILIIAYLCVK